MCVSDIVFTKTFRMKKLFIYPCFLLLILSTVQAQKPQKLNSNQIYEKLQKLNFLGSVLYIAAHPDDENTRLIAYMANHLKARTGYLSLTRGDGGQNLIGPEIRELLGVIRTQELLAARGIDGGEQFFTRANDFGYSKHPEETLKIWNKEAVLSDVVWAIRRYKPDVIINRFNHRTPGTTHGHHTASAMLSFEAFDLAGDKTQFSEQLKLTETWSPKRLFFNTSSWFYRNKDAFRKAAKSFTSFNVGVYYPLKGLSNNELASMASSQHLCQGFGRLTTRGNQQEYIEFLKGDLPKDSSDIFSGINTTWNRLKDGGEIGDILYKVEASFDFINPAKHFPALLEAYTKIQQIEDSHWRNLKEKQILEIIEACIGLYLEASVIYASAVPSASVEVSFEALNRSEQSVQLVSIAISNSEKNIEKELILEPNKRFNFKETIALENLPYSDPYWLKAPASLGMYSVNNPSLVGSPETSRPIQIDFNVLLEGQPITFTKDVIHRYAERDKGEIYEPFEIVPRVTTKLKDKVILFAEDTAQKITVAVKSGASNITGVLQLQVPKGWSVSPISTPISIIQKGDEKTIDFRVTPPQEASEGMIKAVVLVDEKEYDKELVEINYNHIPKQTVLMPSQAKVVRLKIQKSGNQIGYIKGAGDAIPESLAQIGYEVTLLNPEEINEEILRKFDAVVLGIRAYNTVKALQFKQKMLLNYVAEGGTMVVQYNTNRRVDVAPPYPMQLSRDRVTDEFAKVTVLEEKHAVLNYPNKITAKDFEGWVQERGLYFPDTWSKEYTAILAMNDKGEPVRKGSLLIAQYGKGNYIYTGLSFFRQLPAGVSGAYKLFANLLSVGKEVVK